MGLTGNYTFTLSGVEISLTNAYAKIIRIEMTRNNDLVGYIGIFKNMADAENETAGINLAVHQVLVSTPLVSGEDAITTVYKAAMLLPMFANMATDQLKTRYTHLEFMNRFSAAEEDRIYTSVIPDIVRALRRFERASYIDVTRTDTIQYVQGLQLLGLLDPPTRLATRAEEILETAPGL